jgi:hypothetical protein
LQILILKYSNKKQKEQFVLINQSEFNFYNFNFVFVNDTIGKIVNILQKGKFPIIKINGIANWDWDTYLMQPFFPVSEHIDLQSIQTDAESAFFGGRYLTPYRKQQLKLFCKLFNNFFVLNPETQKYVDAEYDELLKGKRVLGVLCRGTNFTDEHHITGHPI